MQTALKTRPYGVHSRNIFPVSMEGCVLSVPLWQEDMQGATFLSYDQYHQLCTVTGATWGSQGRAFDGSDDHIDCGTSSVLDVAAADFSIGGWFNSTNTDLEALAGKIKYANNQWGLSQSGGKYYFTMQRNIDGSDVSAEKDAVYIAGVWYHVFGVINNGLMTLYINGVAQTTTATYTGVRPDTAADKFYIARRVTDNANNFTGTVGEGYLYNRALAGPEIRQNYLVTKWRFI